MLNPPQAVGVEFPLMGRTVVFDDGVRRAALISLDLVALMQSTVAEIRAAATIGTELEPTDVMITCSHTHRAPYVAAAMDYDADFEYLDWLRDRLVVGVRGAWAVRQPARPSRLSERDHK